MHSFVGILITLAIALVASNIVITAGTKDAYSLAFDTFSFAEGYERDIIALGNTLITADIANTPEKRALGLSGRETLLPDTGMLFVFDTPGSHDIWMKDMRFPIDILWIDINGTIVHIEKNVSPDTYPSLFSSRYSSLSFLPALSIHTTSRMEAVSGDDS
jgi:uncharacterized membrane protein (UPF0127 family)